MIDLSDLSVRRGPYDMATGNRPARLSEVLQAVIWEGGELRKGIEVVTDEVMEPIGYFVPASMVEGETT